jgi:hypothetical protein
VDPIGLHTPLYQLKNTNKKVFILITAFYYPETNISEKYLFLHINDFLVHGTTP